MANENHIVVIGNLADDPEVSSESAAESLLWAVVRPPGGPASPTRRRPALVAVAGGRR